VPPTLEAVNVLDEILRTKRDEVSQLLEPSTRGALRDAAQDAPPPRDFVGGLRRSEGNLAVIAEIKRRSPSKGVLAAELDPASTAAAYERGGASALSVLTDAPYFGGSAADLRAARGATDLPILRKDFTIDDVQLDEARALGADAVLLIVRAFDDDGLLHHLHERARALGLGVLVEAHDGPEIDRAVAIGAACIGVNARDLTSFAENLDGVAALRARIPLSVIAVAESAIRTPDDVSRMAAAGFDAVLVGEALVTAPDPVATLRKLAEIQRSAR
jgi:indole-3-glycerol phosphate synthase